LVERKTKISELGGNVFAIGLNCEEKRNANELRKTAMKISDFLNKITIKDKDEIDHNSGHINEAGVQYAHYHVKVGNGIFENFHLWYGGMLAK